MRRIAIAAATLSIAASSVALAVPASAATTTITLANCTAALDGQSFDVPAGDTLRINFTACTPFVWFSSSSPGTFSPSAAIDGNSYAYSAMRLDVTGPAAGPMVAGTSTVYFTNSGSPSSHAADGSFTVTVGGSGGGSSDSSSATSDVPPPVIQQFGKPVSGTCADAAPSTLNWGGAPSGGWGESWAQWMNGGLGGAVCSRTLVYSQSAGAWTVA